MQIPKHLMNHHYNDRYFDLVDAINEAKQVFFQGTDLLEILKSKSDGSKQLTIGETGFGAGRVLVALIDYLDKSEISDVAIIYNSVELHPLTQTKMAVILEQFRKETGPVIDLLIESYSHIDITTPQWHRMHLTRSFGTITLNLWIGEALEMVNGLAAPCDVWFLDGHGPKKNPAMWRQELFNAIGEKTRSGGRCATYTVAGEVKRGLNTAGFSVEKVVGCGWKKEVLRGVKREG